MRRAEESDWEHALALVMVEWSRDSRRSMGRVPRGHLHWRYHSTSDSKYGVKQEWWTLRESNPRAGDYKFAGDTPVRARVGKPCTER